MYHLNSRDIVSLNYKIKFAGLNISFKFAG